MENLTTKESLDIIQTVINERKQQYEQNGIFLIIWGGLIAIAAISQYIMILMGKGEISWYSWLFTMIPGFIITFIVKFNQERKKAIKKESTDMHGWLWAIAGTLAMLTGFLFGNKFGVGFTTVIYLPFCIVAMASALSLKNSLWIILTLIGTILAYSALFIPGVYHPLVSAGVSTLLFLIPGIQLFIAYKKRQDV